MDNQNNNNKIVVICGPTAVGKTEIALEIAEDFDMEIVSCDSMQLYKYMDIGSAKPTKEELERVPHHMIDVIDPTEIKSDPTGSFTVAKFSEMARSAIDDILIRGKTPLIVGGTGLYLDSIIYDMDYAATPGEDNERDELYEIAENQGAEALYKMLLELDPTAAKRIHPNNIKRVVRAIEAAKSGRGIQEYKPSFDYRPEYNPILIGLTRERSELYDRINKRVDVLMDKGLLQEVESLMKMGLTSADYPMKGIGYKELIDALDGQFTLEEGIEQVKTNSRHYAKRQITWFKRYEDMKWFDLTGVDSNEKVKEITGEIEEWLKTKL